MEPFTREKILDKIAYCFTYATQGSDDEKGLNEAEALIELLEENDCGQHGGYDPDNKFMCITGFKLFDRFLTVIRKYNKISDVECICGFTIVTLGIYYRMKVQLRDAVLNGAFNFCTKKGKKIKL